MSAAAPKLPELTVRSFNVATLKPELPAVQGGWHTRHIAAATLIGLASASLIVGLSLGLAYFRTNTVTNTVPVVKVVVPDWAVFPEETGVWTYVTSASNGPANWGKIVVNSSTSELMYPNCAKFAQSPINIDIGTTTVATPPTYNPQRFYNATLFKISPRPSGHPGFQVLPINGTAVWKVDGVDYYLLQFHYHSPSEHTVNGVRLPLEVHFVHQNAAGDLAVFGILYPLSGEENSGIKANPFIAAWWDQIFTENATTITYPIEFSRMIDDVLPTVPIFRYSGSLTTPPCTEGVKWHVAVSQEGVSKAEVYSYKFALETVENFRPVQSLNNRTVTKQTPVLPSFGTW